MIHSLQVIYKDPNELIPNKLNSEIFGDPQNNQRFEELLKSVIVCGILQPIIITKDNRVRSGNMRRLAGIKANLSQVPCILEIDTDELHKVSEAKNKGQIIDDYKTVTHDINKGDTKYAKYKRIKILEDYYGLKQGVRSDKSPELKEAKQKRDEIATSTERTQYNTIQKNLETIFPDDKAKQKEYWKKVGSEKSVRSAVKETTMLAVKANEPENINDHFDYITDQIRIYNQSCLDLAHIPDKSIQAVVCSPPYYKMRPPQDGFENELGQEATVDLFVERLIAHFIPCKVKLTNDGSLWVNLADNVKQGCYTLSTERFIIKMESAGFYLHDLIYWVKINSQPAPDSRTTRNVEYLMNFKLDRNQNPYCDFTWLNGIKGFEESSFGTGHGIKLASFVWLNEGIVTTSTANTARLREACEKAGFYLEHSSTFPPEIPFLCIKTSCKKGSHVIDLFNGCGNTAKAALYADMDIIYHGFEINPVSVRASKVNVELDFGKQAVCKSQAFPASNTQSKKIAS